MFLPNSQLPVSRLLGSLLSVFLVAGCASSTLNVDTRVLTHDSRLVPTIHDSLGPRVHRILYHALVGDHYGRSYGLAEIARSGYTGIHYWEPQDLEDVSAAAATAGLRVIPHYPTLEDVARHRDDPTILAWYLDEEPTQNVPPDGQIAARAAFQERRGAIRDLDPDRAVFLLDGPPIRRFIDDWREWVVLGDLAVHDFYAVNEILGAGTPAAYVAESVHLTKIAVPHDRPIWFTVQAFSDPKRGWSMPTPEQYRAMAMSALIHGATGLITFALDSFVTRDDNVIGISRTLIEDYTDGTRTRSVADYNSDGKAPAVATARDIEQSQLLWREVAAFNAFLETVEAPLLSRTVVEGVSLTAAPVESAAVRGIVKSHDGGLHVFLVNLSKDAAVARFRCERVSCRSGRVTVTPVWPFSEPGANGYEMAVETDGDGLTIHQPLASEGVMVFVIDPRSD